MTRITAAIIANDPEVYAASFGTPETKFGLYIGTWDTAPSGWKRPRDLVISSLIYESAEQAKAAAEQLIASVRAEAAGSPRRKPA
jgi:hypothetical protein